MKLYRVFSIVYQIINAVTQIVWAVKEIFAIFDDEENEVKNTKD